jgi:hypothetical protein
MHVKLQLKKKEEKVVQVVSKQKTNLNPNTPDAKAQLKKFFQNFMPAEQSYLIPWREAASDEIKKYTEAGRNQGIAFRRSPRGKRGRRRHCKGSAASRKHPLRMGIIKNRALRIGVSLSEGNSTIGVFVQDRPRADNF